MYQNHQGVDTYQYASGLDFVHQRGIFKSLYNRDREDAIFDTIISMGRMIGTSTTKYGHHEAGSVFENLKIASLDAVNSTATVAVFNITTIAVDAVNGGSVYGDAASGYFSYPVKGNQVMFTNRSQGIITKIENSPASQTHKIWVTRVNAQTVNTMTNAAVVGEMVMCFSNAQSEGSKAPKGRVSNTEYHANQLQIIREKYEVTGSSDTEEIEFDIEGKGKFFSLKGAIDTELRFRAQMEMAFIFSDLSDGTATDEDNEDLERRTTKGLYPSVRDEGWEQNGANGVAATVDNTIDPMIRKLDALRAGPEHMLQLGVNLKLELDKSIRVEMQNYGGIQWSNDFGPEAKQKAEALGFNTFGMAGYTFHARRLPVLSHNKLAGSAGFTFSKMGFSIPMDYMKDPKTKVDMPAFACKYKEGNGQNRWFKTYETGANARPTPTNDEDKRTRHWQTEMGAHFMGIGQYGLIQSNS